MDPKSGHRRKTTENILYFISQIENFLLTGIVKYFYCYLILLKFIYQFPSTISSSGESISCLLKLIFQYDYTYSVCRQFTDMFTNEVTSFPHYFIGAKKSGHWKPDTVQCWSRQESSVGHYRFVLAETEAIGMNLLVEKYTHAESDRFC